MYNKTQDILICFFRCNLDSLTRDKIEERGVKDEVKRYRPLLEPESWRELELKERTFYSYYGQGQSVPTKFPVFHSTRFVDI